MSENTVLEVRDLEVNFIIMIVVIRCSAVFLSIWKKERLCAS